MYRGLRSYFRTFSVKWQWCSLPWGFRVCLEDHSTRALTLVSVSKMIKICPCQNWGSPKVEQPDEFAIGCWNVWFGRSSIAYETLKNKMQFSNTDWWEVPLQNGLKMSLWAFGSSLVTFWPISGWKKKLKKTRENRENFAISAPWCTNDLNFCVCSSFLNRKLFC